jgi:hypothetical protein
MSVLQTPEEQAVQQAARNIMIELDLRRMALDTAAKSMYEGTAYEVTETAEVFLEFLQTGAAVANPNSTGAVTNE